MGLLTPRKTPSFFLLLLLVVPLAEAHPSTVLWAGPAILVSAIAIAWAAESAQFFIAQGFALAILAWLQTLPEFAVEAVLAWLGTRPGASFTRMSGSGATCFALFESEEARDLAADAVPREWWRLPTSLR